MTELGPEEMTRMLTRQEVSERTGIPDRTLRGWSATWAMYRKGPKPTKLGPNPKARIRYRLVDLLQWQERCANGDYDRNEQVEAEYEHKKAS